ncbi:serine hydrolase [Streptomyces sp. NBC_01205]|uniref:serine hydrolase n=1 Tax=Streptomyces sp. NBC_01205 TaxID=2903771 RepID=UPI002E1126FD|nr:serine hydrolase [Streptomyces sp. NBC_01205]
MKAMKVAGGPPEDPELEGTTTAGAGPDDTSTEPDTADDAKTDTKADAPEVGADPDEDEESEAGQSADETQVLTMPARTAVKPKRNTEADATAPVSPAPKASAPSKKQDTEPEPADEPESRTDTAAEADAKADGTLTLTKPARAGAKSVDAAAASNEPEPERDAGPTPDSGKDTGPESADEPASRTDIAAEAGEKADGTLTLTKPARAGAKPGTEPSLERDAAAASNEPERDARPIPDSGKDTGPESADEPAGRTDIAAEAGEKADGTLTLTKPARAGAKPETKAGAKPGTKAATRADAATEAEEAPASTADGENTRTIVFRAPDTAATDTPGDDAEARRDANKEARPSAEDASGDESDAQEGQTGTDPKAKPKPKADSRRTPAWARGKADEKEGGTGTAPEAAPETDPERTSQFVALKPLDLPAPSVPHPHPQAPTQVPAPATPRPPLDLLAELTNTPAPPETPHRTALRRVKVWTPILLLLAGAYAGAQLLRPLPTPHVVATKTAHTVDGQFSIPWPAKGQGAVRVPGSGDIGTFGDQTPVPMASVAKVMTAYVILKGHPLRKNEPGPDITIDAKTVADGNSDYESRIQGLTAGTKFSQQDVLKMLMIPSGNNAARLLARWDTGTDSEAAFVEKMNGAARDLGMKDTTYTDPSGLDAGTVSTATDQLKLAEAVMKDEVFRTIVAMPSAPIKGLAKPLLNNNELLSIQSLSVRGIKTGSSTPAGGALMWAAYKSVGDETPLILGTLMQQRVDGPDPYATNSLALALTNSRQIIEAVRTALASTPLVRKGDTVGYVDDGLGGRTPLVATKDLNVIGVPGQQVKLTLTAGAAPLPHEAKAGTEVGTLKAGDGEGAKSVPVALQHTLTEPSTTTRLTRLR